jgi:LPS export ABC transporter protein LptC
MNGARLAGRTLLFGALAGLAAASWWLLRSTAVPPAPVATPEKPDYVIEGVTATSLDAQGAPRYRITAPRLTHFPGRGFEIEQPYLVQYGEGAPVHTRANEGLMSDDRKTIEMRGEVRVARGRDPHQAGGEIATDSLRVRLAE